MCFSIVVLDPSTGRVLASERVHTGGNATAPAGAGAASAPAGAAGAGGVGAAAAPGQDPGPGCMDAIAGVLDLCIKGTGSSAAPQCCSALRALGPPCLGQLVAVAQSGEGGQTELASSV